MQNLESVTIGRLKSKTDFSQGIEFDLTKTPTFIPVIHCVVKNTLQEFAIVIAGFSNDYFGERFVTSINHFFIVKSTIDGADIWTVMEDEHIDKEIFPNLRSLVTDMDLFLLNGHLYEKTDIELYVDDLENEKLDENGDSFSPPQYHKKINPSAIPYYQYLQGSSTGQAIFTMITNDIKNRLTPFIT